MRLSIKRILVGMGIFFITVGLAVTGYMVLSSASFIDAWFMVIVTIFSVGYEEVIPVVTPLEKMYTTVVIVLGCSSLLYIIGGFIQMATEGEIARALGEQRNTREIEKLKNHAIICGFGRMGQIIAQELTLSHFPFVVIDSEMDRVKEARELGYLALSGDATEEDTLKSAQIECAKSLATVLPNDAMNVFITLSGRNLNKSLSIYARGEVYSTEAKLEQAGADHVVLPAAIGGLRLAHMIVRPSASHLLETIESSNMINDDLEQLGVRLSEIHIKEGSEFVGKTLGELEIMGEGGFLIVAIYRHDGSVVKKPTCDCTCQAGDTVIVIGNNDRLPRFTLNETPAQKIVLGGGLADEEE
ncbi:MAG: potassium channel protein [Candidatus Hydrogenedentota bacterium]|nr:MAG: potassium channel protein [Candidatus Hydrogenedentota bacterium]